MQPALPQKLAAEFLRTSFFVLTIGMAVAGDFGESTRGIGDTAPLAIGSCLMVMIFAGGHISGGHFNPAVTLAVFVRDKLPAAEVIPHWVAQIAGSLAATGVFLILNDEADEAAEVASTGDALIVEILFTFALAYVVLNVATAVGTEGNSFYGLAIGFTVLVGAYAVGAISGGAFNPAVGVGIVAMSIRDAADIWIYLVGCLAGGGLAGIAFNFITTGQPVAQAAETQA